MSAYNPPTNNLAIFNSAEFLQNNSGLTLAEAQALFLLQAGNQSVAGLESFTTGIRSLGTITATGAGMVATNISTNTLNVSGSSTLGSISLINANVTNETVQELIITNSSGFSLQISDVPTTGFNSSTLGVLNLWSGGIQLFDTTSTRLRFDQSPHIVNNKLLVFDTITNSSQIKSANQSSGINTYTIADAGTSSTFLMTVNSAGQTVTSAMIFTGGVTSASTFVSELTATDISASTLNVTSETVGNCLVTNISASTLNVTSITSAGLKVTGVSILSGNINLNSGFVTSPSLTFTSDTNSGLFLINTSHISMPLAGYTMHDYSILGSTHGSLTGGTSNTYTDTIISQNITSQVVAHRDFLLNTNARGAGSFWLYENDAARKAYFGTPYNAGSNADGFIWQGTNQTGTVGGSLVDASTLMTLRWNNGTNGQLLLTSTGGSIIPSIAIGATNTGIYSPAVGQLGLVCSSVNSLVLSTTALTGGAAVLTSLSTANLNAGTQTIGTSLTSTLRINTGIGSTQNSLIQSSLNSYVLAGLTTVATVGMSNGLNFVNLSDNSGNSTAFTVSNGKQIGSQFNCFFSQAGNATVSQLLTTIGATIGITGGSPITMFMANAGTNSWVMQNISNVNQTINLLLTSLQIG